MDASDKIVARERVLIMGAAGRDFHNFNVVYRDNASTEVVAFTASQIPDIAGRRYPPPLAGPRYPAGIAIHPEAELADLCRRERVTNVVFAYSDVSHREVMHRASVALAAGTDFTLLGPDRTMVDAKIPVIAVCAVRTGCGKSQVSRWLAGRLKARGLRVGVMRHPMPYGDLEKQAVQRFACKDDLDAARCTFEEREEYEPHLAEGNRVYAGVDTVRTVALAEAENDILLWDGGNNDFPFVRPDLQVTLVDPLRPGHETDYHPGETVLRRADIVVIAKSDVAGPAAIDALREAVERTNPNARIVRGASPVHLEDAGRVAGRRVLVVEDGPTLTHGGMGYGAGYVAARKAGAAEFVDPRLHAASALRKVYADYPHIGMVLPAVGYSAEQIEGLRQTINAAAPDIVVSATPIDLAARVELDAPVLRARYEFAETEDPGLGALVETFLESRGLFPQ